MDELDALRAEAEALGIKVDGRWGVDRLRAEVSAARPAEDDEPDDDEPGDDDQGDDELDADDELEESYSPVTSLEPELPRPFRAGGHVNHGDGRGWVLEPEE